MNKNINYSLTFRRILPQEMENLVQRFSSCEIFSESDLFRRPTGTYTYIRLLEDGFVGCFKLLVKDVFLDTFQHITLAILNSHYC